MFGSIFKFEIKYHLRQPLFWGVTLFFLLMTFGAVVSDSVQIGGSIGNVNRNAPTVIIRLLAIMSAIGIFVVTAFVASAVHRDFAHRTHELFFSRPVSKFDYLIGRFSGTLVVSFLIMTGAALGILIGSFMPWLDAERIGPFVPTHYLNALFVFILPNLFFIGAVFFTLASLTRSMMATYMGVVGFFVIYLIATFMMMDMENQSAAALIDPFGLASMAVSTRYWTIVELNSTLPPLMGNLLYNRLLWIGVGLVVLTAGYSRFRFTTRAVGKRASRRMARAAEELEGESLVSVVHLSALPGAHRTFTAATSKRQYLRRTRHEVKSVFRGIPFLVMLAFGMFNVLGAVWFSGKMFGTPTYPVTHMMLRAIDGSYMFMLVILITFYSGEMIWRERSLKLDEVCDSLPTPSWIYLTSKLTALVLVVLVFTMMGMVTTAAYQLYQGYANLEPGLYAKGFLIAAYPFCLITVLACTVQALSGKKLVGYLIMILYIVSQSVLGLMDFDHNLYQFASTPKAPYSDMNGYGHFVAPLFWFDAYWTFFALFLTGLCVIFWVRGTDTGLRTRLRLARARFRGAAAGIVACGLLGAAGTGSYILYNTNILNEYVPTDRREERQADYEKNYRQYLDVALPRITDVYADVDIYPHERRVEIMGHYRMVNRTSVPIDSLHLSISPRVTINSLEFRPHRALVEDEELGYYIYGLDEPLAPGDTMAFDFDLTVKNRGFVNNDSNTRLVYNGTFFDNMDYFPALGYNEMDQLVDRSTRRKYELEPVHRMARIDDEFARRNTYFTRGADWINFETTVSTSGDQIAVSPGYLQEEWRKGDRRYFHYKMDVPILNFYSYLSADYTVKRDRWNDVAIEIYYYEPHYYNVDRMIDAVKKSLDYYTANFGPYQHKQVRILEFPRYQTFAQSFPNTIPYSESVGFIARMKEEDDVDYVFYVTAHEVAHQWWAHQVIGANVQGATMLSESFAQYSALMVMEKEYGREHMRKFLKDELDRYLSHRGGELVEEMPLMLVENQTYIHYEKGSLVMYAMRDYLGEDVLNAVLKRFRDAVAYQEPPYTTTREFMTYLGDATPDSLSYLLQDMFETITLYSNRVMRAEWTRREDGTYLVSLDIEARKMRADGLGVETEIAIDDWIDIGVFGGEEVDGKSEEKVLYMRKRKIDRNEMSLEIVVGEEPVRAGIDPYNKLIDRNSDDNVKRVNG